MSGWRQDIATMRQLYTGEQSEGWRNDWIAIAQSMGHNPQSWREAIRFIAQDYGIQPSGWRSDLSGIAQAFSSSESLSWRVAIRFIRKRTEEEPIEPPEIKFFLNTLPRQPNTRYIILVEGIIESDKIIMA